jgi:hypothetical protein
LTRTWGEAAIGRTGMGIAFAMLFLLVIGCGTALTALARNVLHSESIMLLTQIVMIGALLIIALIFSALSGIYAVALYRYASDSAGTSGFDSDALAAAFYARDQ